MHIFDCDLSQSVSSIHIVDMKLLGCSWHHAFKNFFEYKQTSGIRTTSLLIDMKNHEKKVKKKTEILFFSHGTTLMAYNVISKHVSQIIYFVVYIPNFMISFHDHTKFHDSRITLPKSDLYPTPWHIWGGKCLENKTKKGIFQCSNLFCFFLRCQKLKLYLQIHMK